VARKAPMSAVKPSGLQQRDTPLLKEKNQYGRAKMSLLSQEGITPFKPVTKPMPLHSTKDHLSSLLDDPEVVLKRKLGLREEEELPEPEYMPSYDGEEPWEPPAFGKFLKEHMDTMIYMYQKKNQEIHPTRQRHRHIDDIDPIMNVDENGTLSRESHRFIFFFLWC
jgi:hypothetical protein